MKLKILISSEEIEKKVAELAGEIKRDYKEKSPLLLGVLKGSFVFMADLMRALDLPTQVEFVRISSYGSSKESSGKVRVVQGLKTPIEGKDVIIVEDIVDTGLTTNFTLKYLRRRKPASLKLCTLFDKPSRRVVNVPIDYRGFVVPNEFLVGYGLDFNEKFRYLPDLCILTEHLYHS
jgi:hypoxanthine phosphoribosyltransferase